MSRSQPALPRPSRDRPNRSGDKKAPMWGVLIGLAVWFFIWPGVAHAISVNPIEPTMSRKSQVNVSFVGNLVGRPCRRTTLRFLRSFPALASQPPRSQHPSPQRRARAAAHIGRDIEAKFCTVPRGVVENIVVINPAPNIQPLLFYDYLRGICVANEKTRSAKSTSR